MDVKIGLRKKGQVTIFIIVAIVIVVGVIGALYFIGGVDVDAPSELGPKVFIDKCVREVVEESVEKMLKNGGERVISHGIGYQGNEYNYLCHHADNYAGCYNLHPMLEEQIEREIYLDTKDAINEECFDTMREDFEVRGYDVTGKNTVYSIDLLPGNIEINLKKKFNISKGETTQNFENFNAKISSPIYDLVRITRDIVNSESQYCYFEKDGYMLLYPKYDIQRINYMESKVYEVIDRESEIGFKFAVRCVVLPAGMF